MDEVENKLIKSVWSFDLDNVYDESQNYDHIYLKQIIESNFFTKIKNYSENSNEIMKSTKIFLGSFSQSFSDTNNSLGSSFLRFILADIINNQNFFLYESDIINNISILITISFSEIFENKILDNFNLDNYANKQNNRNKNHVENTSSNYNSNIKIFEQDDEIVMDGIKEIQITKIEQFDKLIK